MASSWCSQPMMMTMVMMMMVIMMTIFPLLAVAARGVDVADDVNNGPWMEHIDDITKDRPTDEGPRTEHIIKKRRAKELKECPAFTPKFSHGVATVSENDPKRATITCNQGYELTPPDNATLICTRHKWLPEDGVYKTCLPKCSPPCPDNGTCVAPDVCQCGNSSCAPRINCPKEVDLVMENADQIIPGSIGGALGICISGYEVSPGASEFLVPCIGNNWTLPTDQDGHPITCHPICFPSCRNEGVCVAPNKCKCPSTTRGTFCERLAGSECTGRPITPKGMNLSAWSENVYGLTCPDNYVLPGRGLGVSLRVTCIKGKWFYPDWKGHLPLTCEPYCLISCSQPLRQPTSLSPSESDNQPATFPPPPPRFSLSLSPSPSPSLSPIRNGGKCVEGEKCQCPTGYEGHYCQIKTCPKLYPKIEHAYYSDNGMAPTSPDYKRYVECERGWTLPSQTKGKVEVRCTEGHWIMMNERPRDNQRLHCIPAPCGSGCENKGQCIKGKCVCLAGTSGEFCQKRMCPEMLPVVKNVWVDRSRFPKIYLSCMMGYGFNNNHTELEMTCLTQHHQWVVGGTEGSNETCNPLCPIPCWNGGQCWAPGECLCPKGYTGKQCEVKLELENHCYFPLPQVEFAEVFWDEHKPHIKCYSGYQLLSGRTEAMFKCHIHRWTLKGETERVPGHLECVPTCANECQQRNMYCVAPNICRCRFDLTGVKCDRKKLDFNCTENMLPRVDNAVVNPIDASVHCFTGYLLVTGECSVLLECEGGVWGHPALLHQGCVPQCSMSCRNGGVCRGPDFCECSEGYYGRECELVQCQGLVPTVEDGYVGFCQKGMTAKCAEGYGFSGGDREVSLICRNETWALPPEVEQDPVCRPKCQHRCNNRGTCVAPDYCRCEEGYGGSDCSGVSCDVIPKELFNWYISLSKTQLTAECPQNAKFSRGESKLSFICVDNTWQYPTSYQHGESLKCIHSCVPPCENGGTCEAHNTCRCRTGFIGRRCEKIKCEGPLPYVKDAVFSFIGDSVLVNCITNFDNKIRGSYWIHCIEGHWNLDSSLGPISSASACSKNEGQRLASGKLESREGFVGEKKLAVSVCEGPPPMVHYADIVYSNSKVGVIKCQSDYVLDNYKTSTQVLCHKNQWRFLEFNSTPTCRPRCPGGCLNGGTCTAPNTCNCPDDTYGSRCEKRSLCVAPPDPPPRMRLVWTKSGYVGVCQTGYTFANPLQSDLLIICVNGSWRKSNLVPCVPKCQVLCINGGTCLAPNTCSCRQGFSGALCRLLVLGNCKTEVDWRNTYVVRRNNSLTITCHRGYKLHTGGSFVGAPASITIGCHDNTWVTPRGWSWDREVCQPFCDPECQGGGVCERPEQCRCPNGIYSPNCSPDTRTGCHGTPMVANATAVKIADHLSRVTCRIGHASSSGAKVFLMRCLNGHWVTTGSIVFPSTRVACYHQCQPRCLHGGQCYGPNRCQCQRGYGGSWCQYRACGNMPLYVPNAYLSFNQESASGIIRCKRGFKLSSGEFGASVSCLERKWVFGGDFLGHLSVSCEPECARPCLNRGRCVSPNFCTCPEGFSGLQCERRYTVTVKGQRCHFPYQYKGRWHFGCSLKDKEGLPWCPTAVDRQGLPTDADTCVAVIGKNKVVMGSSGRPCQFPFYLQGQQYDSCVKLGDDDPVPKCPLILDQEGVPTMWDSCDKGLGLEDVVTTVSGRTCIFPFRYNGFWQTTCVKDNRSLLWCATQLTDDYRPLDVDVCWHDVGYKKMVVTAEGRVCVFPFLHQGLRQFSCVGSSSVRWCATTIDFNLKPTSWGVCVPVEDCSALHQLWLGGELPSQNVIKVTGNSLTSVN